MVVKRIVDSSGNIANSVPAGPGWQFTAATGSVSLGTQTTTTDQTGTVQFDLAPITTTTADVKVSEQLLSGYTLLPADGKPGGLRSVCRSLSDSTRHLHGDQRPGQPHRVHREGRA